VSPPSLTSRELCTHGVPQITWKRTELYRYAGALGATEGTVGHYAERALIIALPRDSAKSGGTAFPICSLLSSVEPTNRKLSGKD
jgi:hypothetical protein